MQNIILQVSKDLKHKIDSYPRINWSEVATNAIQAKISQLKSLKQTNS